MRGTNNLQRKIKNKLKFILRNTSLPSFSRDIQLKFHTEVHHTPDGVINNNSTKEEINDIGIYLFQKINVNNLQCFSIMVVAILSLLLTQSNDLDLQQPKSTSKSSKSKSEEFKTEGTSTQSQHGIYSVKIQLNNGTKATMSGVCLSKVTSTFPTYQLSKVYKDIQCAFKPEGGDVSTLPTVPVTIGGDVDIMIGVKYLRYHPKLIFELSSGLSIFQSMFDNANGGCGVIGGPHEEFTQTNQQFYKHHHNQSFFTNMFSSVNGPDTLLGYKQFGCDVYVSDHEEDNSTT